jgi:hypothetical protein
MIYYFTFNIISIEDTSFFLIKCYSSAIFNWINFSNKSSNKIFFNTFGNPYFCSKDRFEYLQTKEDKSNVPRENWQNPSSWKVEMHTVVAQQLKLKTLGKGSPRSFLVNYEVV